MTALPDRWNIRGVTDMKRDMQTTQVMDNVTRLSLLTRDGAVAVEFVPALDMQHYSELLHLAGEFDSEPELRSLVFKAAERWGRTVSIG